MRQEFSKHTKASAMARAGGKCEGCGIRLTPLSGIEYDHIVPCAIGGDAEVENCQVLCRNCHGAKSNGRAPGSNPDIAKGKRIHAKHIRAQTPTGFRKPKGFKFDWKLGRYVRAEE